MNTAKVLIVSHDAGGAYLLSKWCRDWDSRLDFSYYLAGPAVDIFSEAIEGINILDNVDWAEVTHVITTTGWQTEFEKQAINIANNKNIYVVSYLDHWANYLERFIYHGKSIFPDELWVADDEAMVVAKNLFQLKVGKFRKIRNRHFYNIKSKIDKYAVKNSVLICLEPIRTDYSLSEAYSKLIYFLVDEFHPSTKIIIRDHPSKSETKIDFLLSQVENHFNVKVSENTLEHDLSHCNAVIGYQSSVLVYAINLGIITYSFYPILKMESILPYKDIIYI